MQGDDIGGKECAVDEITVHMDAPKASLKRNCHHYKAAGDGMQADALCQNHGYIKDFIWRGDPKVPPPELHITPKARF